MTFNPLKHAFDDDGKPTPALNGFLDNALKVQRPVVLRWVKRLRAEHPDETPEQIAKRLERMYVRANTATGGVAGGIVDHLEAIEVDQQHAALGGDQRGGQVDAGGGLADSAFLVGDREYLGHLAPL